MKFSTATLAAFVATVSAMRPDRVVRDESSTSTLSGITFATQEPVINQLAQIGCFASMGELKENATIHQYQSKGRCAEELCKGLDKPVAGLIGGNRCFCGDKYPPESSKVDLLKCNIPCAGYPHEACGGRKNLFTIYNTGLDLDPGYSDDDGQSSSSSSSSSGSTPSDKTKPTHSVYTEPGTTIVVTSRPDSNDKPDEEEDGGNKNTAGIAAGVVVGVVAVAAIIGGGFFFMRRKRNKEIEEEHRRNAAANSFMGGQTPTSMSTTTDSRLDPVLAHRRMSDGSIADNQDYSRKILRVTNA